MSLKRAFYAQSTFFKVILKVLNTEAGGDWMQLFIARILQISCSSLGKFIILWHTFKLVHFV